MERWCLLAEDLDAVQFVGLGGQGPAARARLPAAGPIGGVGTL